MAHYAILQARTDLSRREMKLYEAKGSAVPASGLSIGLAALGSGKGFICSLSHSLQFCAAPSLAQTWCLLTQVKRTFSLSSPPACSIDFLRDGGRKAFVQSTFGGRVCQWTGLCEKEPLFRQCGRSFSVANCVGAIC